MAKRRWTCPECGSGKLMVSAPRAEATGRFCLKCSEKTGTLVRRVCPALDKKRAKASDRSKAKAAKVRQAARDRFTVGDINVLAELKRVWKVARFLEPNLPKEHGQLTLHRSGHKYTSGRAWQRNGRVHLTAGTDATDLMYVLVHEVAHHVVYARDWSAPAHGDVFKAAEAELLAETKTPRTDWRK